jgi:hypothetical protein
MNVIQLTKEENPKHQLLTVGDLFEAIKHLPRETPLTCEESCSYKLFSKKLELRERTLWHHDNEYWLVSASGDHEEKDLARRGFKKLQILSLV